jgi:hypothetical protein
MPVKEASSEETPGPRPGMSLMAWVADWPCARAPDRVLVR